MPIRSCYSEMLCRATLCFKQQADSHMHANVSAHDLQVMMDFLKEWEEKLHVKITCSQVRPGLLTVLQCTFDATINVQRCAF